MSTQELDHIKLFVDESIKNKDYEIMVKLGMSNENSYLSKLSRTHALCIYKYIANDVTLTYTRSYHSCTEIRLKYKDFSQRLPYELFSRINQPRTAEYTLYDYGYAVNFTLAENYLFIIRENRTQDKLLLQYAEYLIFKYKLEAIARYYDFFDNIASVKILC